MIDWLKQLDRGMDRMTTEALRITAEARKAAGIDVGCVTVLVPSRRFSLGDEVHGEAVLELESAMHADRVTVTLRAQRDAVGIEKQADGGVRRVRRTTTVHEFTRDLAGAGTVQTERMPFSLPLPRELEATVEAAGVMGDVLKVARGLRDLTQGPVRWTVEATVVLPWKRNIRGRVDLAVE